jgi:hypothetical protein
MGAGIGDSKDFIADARNADRNAINFNSSWLSWLE